MRKLLFAAVAAVAVLVIGAVAYAANVYTVDGGTKPRQGDGEEAAAESGQKTPVTKNKPC